MTLVCGRRVGERGLTYPPLCRVGLSRPFYMQSTDLENNDKENISRINRPAGKESFKAGNGNATL
jgi:hypothetical protein